MAAADTVKRYFEAMGTRDLDAALGLWKSGGVERIVGGPELIAPEGIRQYFGELFAAFPDFKFEVLQTAAEDDRVAVRWRARGTFAGPGRFQGFEPNGAQVEIEGCDLVTVSDGRITHNDAYLDSGDVARQLGFLPATGSSAEAALTKLANARTRVRARMQASEPEPVADGVWVLRGGFPARMMNVYLIGDDGGVTVFDAGIEDMTRAIRIAAVRMGGINRVVLGHADAEDDEVAGFRVVELPGHAPALFGLFRERDRLALVSDCFYTLDLRTGMRASARVPHRSTNFSTEQAADSIRKLARLRPSAAWAGHSNPVTGGDVVSQLHRAAETT